MANNEAKIKFSAETGEFNKAIQKSNSEMTELRAELRLNETQMKATGNSVEGLENKHSILSKQLKASEDKTEALNQKVQKAVEIFGENSQEATKLRTQLLNAQNAEEKLRQAVNKCAEELEDQKKAEKETESATETLTKTLDKQQSELDKLKSEYVDVALQHGKNSKEAKDLAKQIDSLSDELKDNKKKLDDAEQAADKFDNSLDEAGKSAEGFDGKMATVAVGVAAATAAMVEFGKSAIDAFNEVDDGADNVIKATGATGEQAEALEESYKNVASSIVGDFSDIGSALGEVNTRFGFTGTEAEEATTQFLKFSEVTGMDATSAVQDVSRAIESAGLKSSDYKSILDALTVAGQATGVSVEDLAASLTDNGAIMRAMGYDTSESIAMLAQFEKAGVDTSSVTKGMRTALGEWAKQGLDAKQEFGKLVKGIADGSVTAAEAYDVFGTKAGVELVDAIQSGRFSYEDMLSVIEGSEGALDSTFDGTVDGGYELELAMQNCKMALAEVGGVVAETLTPVFQALSDPIIPAVVAGFGDMVGWIKDAVSWMKEHKAIMVVIASVVGVLTTAITAYNIVQGIKTAMDAANVTTVWGLVAAHWAQATAAMAAIAPYILIVAAIAAVIAIIVLCVKYWDEIVAAVKKAWEAIKNAVSTAINAVKSVVTKVMNAIKSVFTTVWNAIKSFVTSVWNGIKSAVTTAVNAVKSVITKVWNAIKTATTTAFNAVKQVVTTVWNAIKNAIATVVNGIKNTVTSVWNGIKNAISTAVNAVKNTVTNVFNGVKNTVSNIFNSVKSKISSIFNSIKSTISKVINGIKNTVSNVFNKIKEAMQKPIEKARDVIKGIVDKIKGFFSGLKISLPKIKLPHFKITGSFSLSPPKVPKLSIDWYKEGGILTNPTIFGMNGNRLMAGGEAGPEAILPIDKLEGYISSAIEKAQSVVNLDTLAAAVRDLANRPIELSVNGRKFMVATAGDGDSVNGLRSTFQSRGLVLD